MKTFALVTLGCLVTAPAGAQWITHPTSGIPRTPDGKPNLSAPAPRTADGKPDLSGLWRIDSGGYGNDVTSDLKPGEVQPWADKLFKERLEDLGKDHTSVQCLPSGPGYSTGGATAKIVQTPALIVILYEDMTYRQIFLDGRGLPQEPNPSWMGYSIGRWEGDTLVIESGGFNDRTWLDFGGHPHTEALRMIERMRRVDFGRIEMHVTLEDPKVYARSFTIPVDVKLMPDTELIEYVCNENEKDRARLVGKASDEKKYKVDVPVATLTKYAGAYEFRAPEDPTVVTVINFTVQGDELFMDFAGKGSEALIPVSGTVFAARGVRVRFAPDATGAVNEAYAQIVEGEIKGVRKRSN